MRDVRIFQQRLLLVIRLDSFQFQTNSKFFWSYLAVFIQNIEFIDPLSKKDRRSNFSIRGGASAIAKTYASTSDGEVYAKAYAKGTGDYSSSAVNTKVKLVNYSSSKGYVQVTV